MLQRALADALPAALRVMPTDLAALVLKVRAKATALAEGHDDPSGMYGEEIRRGLTIFGKQSRESIDLENEEMATHPTRASLGDDGGLPSVIVESERHAALDDDTTLSLLAPVVAPPPVAPAPLAPMPMPMPVAAPPPVAPGATQATALPPPEALSPRHKVVIAVVAPIAAATLIGIGIVVGSRSLTPSAIAAPRTPERASDDAGARPPRPVPLATGLPISRE